MKITTVVVLLLTVAAFTYPPAEVKLEYRFKTGDQYVWTQDTHQDIKQNLMGMDQKAENTFHSVFVLKVAETTPTGAKLECSYTKLKSSNKSPMGDNSMDSEGPADKMENKIFQSMINKPFFIYLTTAGKVEKIENAKNLWSGFESLGLDETQKKAIRESLEMMLGEDALKGSFQSAFIPYPDKKSKVGEKWTYSDNVVVSVAMAIENTWSLVALNSASANLEADGTFKTIDKEKVLNLPGGLKAKSDLSGRQATKSVVDVKSGWPTKQDVLAELKGKMTLLAGGMIPQDMEIPMEILSETTYTIKKE